MPVVAIIGAGDIGGAVARALTMRARVESVRLIDDNGDIASGKALDLMQSAAVARSDTRIDGGRGLAEAAGAAVIVLADAATGTDEDGRALALLRKVRGGGIERSIVVCAAPGHGAAMQQAFDEWSLPRRRVLGSAPEALASTARALVAVEAKAAVNQVALTLIGRPGRFLVPWSDASVCGHGAVSMLSAPQLRRIEHRLSGLWPPGPNALGMAAASFCEAIVQGSRRIFSAFVALDRDNGTRAPVCAWPVSVGPTGLERVTRPVLSSRDQIVVDEVLQ